MPSTVKFDYVAGRAPVYEPAEQEEQTPQQPQGEPGAGDIEEDGSQTGTGEFVADPNLDGGLDDATTAAVDNGREDNDKKIANSCWGSTSLTSAFATMQNGQCACPHAPAHTHLVPTRTLVSRLCPVAQRCARRRSRSTAARRRGRASS